MIGKLIQRFKRVYHYKSAVTGKYVTKAFADAHMDTCYRIRVK